ncbi:Gfo/Idh/MocA family oxidoreductase [Bellilinea sp.]|jgi:predicted dehydrogenase|uniref:Gfo/Idh/MocA family protein n=1 Tax=Bellilinea sp. TaxID=2838785 RepID=UPI002ADE542F|nr:Gfo/Idh/MocA family oxidoreductase [Bellilinea sp.]
MSHKIAMLGTGLIGRFYTMSLLKYRGQESVVIAYSRRAEQAEKFAAEFGIPRWTTDMAQAIRDPEVDTVVIGLPNYLHKQAALLAAEAGKAVLCTKPLATHADEALEMLEAVEKAGVFHGYLEDLVYTPKTLKALESARKGALGKILWARSRETHGGPHSDWFWTKEQSGGGAIVDMGCHCIEIARNFIGKENRPIEVTCWADTQVHPIDAEDHAVGLVRYDNGAIGQFEVSWTFRGGMDLRDEIAGTEGTVWLNHWLRTGFEMFTAVGQGGYVAEKAEGDTGWLFPVGDEIGSLGYVEMFLDMFNAMDEGRQPMETFYDGYVVNAIIDACYKSAQSKKWEPVELKVWRGGEGKDRGAALKDYDEEHYLIKEERMPNGNLKIILKDKKTGAISQIIRE